MSRLGSMMSIGRPRPRGRNRVACAALLLAGLAGCAASSNLDTRPHWAGGTLPDEPQDTDAAIAQRYPDTLYFKVVADGRAPRGKIDQARAYAEQKARADLGQIIMVKVKSEFASSLKVDVLDGVARVQEHIGELIETSSSGVLSNTQVVSHWDGFDQHDDVVFVRVALDRLATARNLAQLAQHEMEAIRGGITQVEQALAGGDLAGLVSRVAELKVDGGKVRDWLLARSVLAGSADGEALEEAARLNAEAEQLGGRLLQPLLQQVVSAGPYTRGLDDARLELRLLLEADRGPLPVPACAVRYRLEGSGRIERVRSDEAGRVLVSLPVSATTEAGTYSLPMTYDLCPQHADVMASPGCPMCDLQRSLGWQVDYQVAWDEAGFQRRWSEGRSARERGELLDEQRLLSEAASLAFDQRSERDRCQTRLGEIGLELTFDDALELEQSGNHQLALDRFLEVSFGIADFPGATPDRTEIRSHAIGVAALYAGDELRGGSDASREEALTRLQLADRTLGGGELDGHIGHLKERLPCTECGRSGECSTCSGTGKQEQACPRCEGEGLFPQDCPDCQNGYMACTKHTLPWVTCPGCKGTWSWDHKKCGGEGCNLCHDGQIWCARCGKCQAHDKWKGKDACVVKTGKVPGKCAECGDGGKSGKLRCRSGSCKLGPLKDANDRTWRGYLLAECSTCNGSGRRLVACSAGCKRGVCPTCGGARHRM